MIRHTLPVERWPTAGEAARARLFSPLPLGRGAVARTRTWVPAMVPWRATDDGDVTPALVDWYARLAAGRPGVLGVEARGIRDVHEAGRCCRIGDDRFVPGLARLVEAVRAASRWTKTLLFIQLIDFIGDPAPARPRATSPSSWPSLAPHREAPCARVTE